MSAYGRFLFSISASVGGQRQVCSLATRNFLMSKIMQKLLAPAGNHSGVICQSFGDTLPSSA